jgi:hypothetical protein
VRALPQFAPTAAKPEALGPTPGLVIDMLAQQRPSGLCRVISNLAVYLVICGLPLGSRSGRLPSPLAVTWDARQWLCNGLANGASKHLLQKIGQKALDCSREMNGPHG